MKTYNVDTKGNEFITANLYEIELARVTVTQTVTDTNILPVLETHLCWYSEDVNNTMNIAVVISGVVKIFKVIYVNKMLNTITLNSAISGTINKDTILCETLYDIDTNVPTKSVSAENLNFYHACFGTLTGTILLTDFDIPIVAKTERALYNDNGFAMYIPFPVNHKEISIETKGKINTVEITAANVNKMLGGVYLKHDAFKNRIVKIRSVFLDDLSYEGSLSVPFVKDNINYKIGFADPIDTDNFTNYIMVTDVVDEFLGEVDNASVNIETLKIQATVSVDANSGTQIPRRLYSRSKCFWLYKRKECRFTSDMTLKVGIGANDTGDIYVNSSTLNYYFQSLNIGETAVITIDNEQILIRQYKTYLQEKDLPILSKNRLIMIGRYVDVLKNDYTGNFTLTIEQRGYGSSTPAAHLAGAKIDIPTCRKTEHDCINHCNIQNIGLFPAIPKNKTLS